MDVEDIHQRDRNVGAYVIFIEGCATAFTDCPALVGSGASSWIGTSYGARSVILAGGKPFLTEAGTVQMVPDLPLGETIPLGAEIKESRVTFRLTDFSGALASLFREHWPDSTTDSMGERLAPTDDPAPETIAGPNQNAVNLWGRNIGIEAIGPAGERRHFWIEPTGAPPGLDHAGGVGWPPNVITDAPHVWAGRMIAVYRVVQDPDDGTWPSWTDQHAGGSLWWVGKLKGRGAFTNGPTGREFHLPCTGIASLLRKNLNSMRPTEWRRPPEISLALAGDELKIAAWIQTLTPDQPEDGISVVPSTYDCQTLASGNTFSGCTTREDFAARLYGVAYTMISDAATNGISETTNAEYAGPVPPVDQSYWKASVDYGQYREISISSDGATIGIKCENVDTAADGFALGIAIDARVAQLFGWDVNSTLWSPASAYAHRCPVGGPLWGENAGDEILPDYHYVGLFSTRVGSYDENQGHEVQYGAEYPEGTVTLDEDAGVIVSLGIGEVPCEGQFGHPFTYGAQIDGDDVDAAGWWIFRGQRLTAAAYLAGEDPVEFVQVGFCEWVATANKDAIAEDQYTHSRLRVVQWYNPHHFGLDYDRIAEPWVNVTGGLECAPIAVFGGTAQQGPDWRHRLIPRLLLSTGTAVWDATGDPVEITPGDNQPSDLPAGDPWAGDMEVADLGLGLPKAWVDWASWYGCAGKLPGGAGGALNRVSYAVLGPVQASDILRQAMAGAGWAWSWKRSSGAGTPEFGAWDPIDPLTPEDIEVTITRGGSAEASSPAGATKEQWGAVIELRNDGPYDRFVFTTDASPLERGGNYELTFESLDQGRRYRDGKIVWEIEDGGLRDPTPWLGTAQEALYTWSEQARERFGTGFGQHYGRAQRVYRDILDATYITRIGLGTVVHVINTAAEAPDGTRGINHLGRVIDCTIINTGGMQALSVAVLLQPTPIDELYVWGPMATAGVGSWNSGTNTLTISTDWAGVGGGHSDHKGFAQPAWDTNSAGSLVVKIYQSETGIDWPAGFVATASVASASSGSLGLTSITGTIYRDTLKVIVAAPYDEQTAAWALALYIPVTDANGEFDSAKGKRL